MKNDRLFTDILSYPSPEYGEVPFYWWTGDRLDKDRLTKQLEELHRNGVAGVQINYAHKNRGGEFDEPYGGHGKSIEGDPYQFSDEWWEFFAHAAHECERLGMGIGVGDYTLAWLGNGFFTDKIALNPEMNATKLEVTYENVFGGISSKPGDDVLAMLYYSDDGGEKPVILYEKGKGMLASAPIVADVFTVKAKKLPMTINPLEPGCGQQLADSYFAEFERRVPGLKPGTLNYFFQDELMFGFDDFKSLWSGLFRERFLSEYGYDILAFVPHLYYNLGKLTAKIRLDAARVKQQLAEENYFKPIYDYHASRGMIYGCDQSSRGRDPGEFGDYFGAVRWFTAPGNDTPGRAADLIKVKVNSSVAHLYSRPRVWLEGYHSGGWGTTLESITSPTSDNFIFGANLLNLHGLYYSTYGGFFEWAPPDYHFRMPYWDDEKVWLNKYKTLANLMTNGVHRCDAAIFYPVSSCDYGENSKKCVSSTFDTAQYLYSNGLDFDFVDYQSIERAVCECGYLSVSGEKYRAVIICDVDAIRYTVIKKLREFSEKGGTVIFVGSTPFASDRAGADDMVLSMDTAAILACPGCSLVKTKEEALGFINIAVTRSFLPDAEIKTDKTYVSTRVTKKETLYFVRYAPKNSVCRFEATGKPYLLDAMTGEVTALAGTVSMGGFTFIKMPNEPEEDTLILFSNENVFIDNEFDTRGFDEPGTVRKYLLTGEWGIDYQPTLDNTYGDFYLPAGGVIGPQARFFDCRVSGKTGYEYTALAYCRRQNIKAVTGSKPTKGLCKALSLSYPEDKSLTFEGQNYSVGVLDVHDRYGIVSTATYDEALIEQGHHGLKCRVHDYNICYREDSVFVMTVYCDTEKTVFPVLSGMKPNALFINGADLSDCPEKLTLPAGLSVVSAMFIYDREKSDGYYNNGGLKHAGIYFACVRAPGKTGYPLAKCDFASDDYLPATPGGEYTFRFKSVPGFSGMKIPLFGELIKAESDGTDMEISYLGKGDFGSDIYCAKLPSPSADVTNVVFTVNARPGCGYTGAIPAPADLITGDNGKTVLTDLSKTGALCSYSGKVIYKKTVRIEKSDLEERFILELGKVSATAEVKINGTVAAVMCCPPFTRDVTRFLGDGENTVEITVSNTLCNHYSTIPSRYSNYPADASYGLMGPVVIKVIKEY